MYNLLLQIIFMGSLGVIVYVIALTIPRVDKVSIIEGKVKKIISNIPLNKIDETLSSYKTRVLRKVRLFTMRLDNIISKSLNKDKDDDEK